MGIDRHGATRRRSLEDFDLEHQAHARTTKGDLYVISLEDVFAANIEGAAKSKSERRAGFGAE